VVAVLLLMPQPQHIRRPLPSLAGASDGHRISLRISVPSLASAFAYICCRYCCGTLMSLSDGYLILCASAVGYSWPRKVSDHYAQLLQGVPRHRGAYSAFLVYTKHPPFTAVMPTTGRIRYH
jgi:hypothetical protein